MAGEGRPSRRKRRTGAWKLQEVGGAVKEFLASRGWTRRAKEGSVHMIWEKVVGDYVTDHTQTLFCRDGKLLVTAETPEWAHEISMQRHLIAQKLNEALGETIITDIHVQALGVGVRPRGTPPVRRKNIKFAGGMSASDEELAAIPIAPDEILRVEAIVRSLAHDELKDIVREALLRDRRIREWKLAHRYVDCPECGALHNESKSLCRLCQLQKR